MSEVSFEQAQVEAQQLTTTIMDARDAYYERDESLIADVEYDALIHRLEEAPDRRRKPLL